MTSPFTLGEGGVERGMVGNLFCNEGDVEMCDMKISNKSDDF